MTASTRASTDPLIGYSDYSSLRCEEFERVLGDPRRPDAVISYVDVLANDEAEHADENHLAALLQAGQLAECLPVGHGGVVRSWENGFLLQRLVSRRDPTLATSMAVTLIGHLPVWIAHDPEQLERVTRSVLRGKGLSWGISEADHGSDLMANDTVAVECAEGYRLTGAKWLIGNGTRSDAMAVLARTGAGGRPGDWSLFLVDKLEAGPAGLRPLPRVPLVGLRGLDMSGMAYSDLVVPQSMLVGRPGRGLELALKTALIIRALITSLALGSYDTALRVTLDFAENRRIFGSTVDRIPYSRLQLAECFADLLAADAVCTSAARALQVIPTQASVFASSTKALIPLYLQRSMLQLSVVLGARSFLRDERHHGIFQKMHRDLAVTVFADGNSVVNLRNVAAELPSILAGAAQVTPCAERTARIANIYTLDSELPAIDPALIQIGARGRDDILFELPATIEALSERGHAVAASDDTSGKRWQALADTAALVWAQVSVLSDELAALRESVGDKGISNSAELVRLAEVYGHLHAGAAVAHMARFASAGPFTDPAVAGLALRRIIAPVAGYAFVPDIDSVERVADVMLTLYRNNRLFALRPVRLAD